MLRLLCVIFVCCYISIRADGNIPPSCESPIYCYGDILHHVQLAKVFDDGKKFVDLRMKYTQEIIQRRFEDLLESSNDKPSRDELVNFVADNFDESSEIEEWQIPDLKEDPEFTNRINNATIKKFAQDVIKIWPSLGRKVKKDVWFNQESGSFIPVPNGFIVPGGRFQEYYYWDSYWVIDGLILNEMVETAKGMVENFISLVDRLGFIPNGGRIYYLRRSQPPLLTPMAYLYYKATEDTQWVTKNIENLAKELSYWEGQSVNVSKYCKIHQMYHYNAVSSGPRPESYREDYLTATQFQDENKQRQVYIDLKSGAESGWDFSNRWVFDNQGGNNANLSYIQTSRVIPVDLNAFLCLAFKQISELYSVIGQEQNSTFWKNKTIKLQKAISDVLWNEEHGIWYDYDLQLGKHSRHFYPSNLTPLWAKCVEDSEAPILGERVLRRLKSDNSLNYPGGIPSSLETTGQQWDFPNCWAPLQDIVVRGLQNSNYELAQDEARTLAERWVNANLIGFQNEKELFEKYDAVTPGKFGGGGEYEVQPGFGWTNGVVLRFIHDYYTN